MSKVEGPIREQLITEYVKIVEDPATSTAMMVHIPTDMLIKKWSAPVGLEEGAWDSMVEYAENAVKLNAVDWETDDIDIVFPFVNFVEQYLDPVGFGEKTAEEVSAEVMEKIMRRFHKKGEQ